MKSLILEASSEHALIADSEGKEVHLLGGPEFSKVLGLEIKGFGSGFERIVVGAGPGSFTGIRVTAAMGQALAFGWGIPLFTAPSLSAFAPEDGEGDFAVAVDAKSGGIYVQRGFEKPILLGLEEAGRLLKAVSLITSPHPAKIVQRLPFLASCRWKETRPSARLLERFAVSASEPLQLHYLVL